MASRRLLVRLVLGFLCGLLLVSQHLTEHGQGTSDWLASSGFRLRLLDGAAPLTPLLHPFHWLGTLDRLVDGVVVAALLCALYGVLLLRRPSLSAVCLVGVLIEATILAAVLCTSVATSLAPASPDTDTGDTNATFVTPLDQLDRYRALHLQRPYQHAAIGRAAMFALSEQQLQRVDELRASCLTLRALYLLAVAAVWWLGIADEQPDTSPPPADPAKQPLDDVDLSDNQSINQSTDNQLSDNQSTDNQLSDNQSTDNQSDNQSTDNQSDNQLSDNQSTINQSTINQSTINQSSNSSTSGSLKSKTRSSRSSRPSSSSRVQASRSPVK